MPLIEIESVPGEMVRMGKSQIVPFAKTMLLRLPGLPAGLSWSRPDKVVVQGEDGRQQSVAIIDVTRRRQVAVAVTGLASSLVLASMIARRK